MSSPGRRSSAFSEAYQCKCNPLSQLRLPRTRVQTWVKPELRLMSMQWDWELDVVYSAVSKSNLDSRVKWGADNVVYNMFLCSFLLTAVLVWTSLSEQSLL